MQVKFKKIFNFEYSETNVWLLIAYAENEMPPVYSTALYFLSYYGMARTLFLIFTIMSFAELILSIFTFNVNAVILFIVSVVLMLLFLFQYLRFVKYYRRHVSNGFLIEKK